MKISRNIAIKILKYLNENTKFYFPFTVVCQECTPEDDDFVEIMPDEWEDMKEDKSYQTFELWGIFQCLSLESTELLSKWFLDIILNKGLEKEIETLSEEYGKMYNSKLTESANILEYWENEFFWGKKEAFEEVLEIMKKYNLKVL